MEIILQVLKEYGDGAAILVAIYLVISRSVPKLMRDRQEKENEKLEAQQKKQDEENEARKLETERLYELVTRLIESQEKSQTELRAYQERSQTEIRTYVEKFQTEVRNHLKTIQTEQKETDIRNAMNLSNVGQYLSNLTTLFLSYMTNDDNQRQEMRAKIYSRKPK